MAVTWVRYDLKEVVSDESMRRALTGATSAAWRFERVDDDTVVAVGRLSRQEVAWYQRFVNGMPQPVRRQQQVGGMAKKITIRWSERCHYTSYMDEHTFRELLAEDGVLDADADLITITGKLCDSETDDGSLAQFLRTIRDVSYVEDRRIDTIVIADGS